MEVIIVILLLGLATGYVVLHPLKSAKVMLTVSGAFLLGLLVLCALYWIIVVNHGYSL